MFEFHEIGPNFAPESQFWVLDINRIQEFEVNFVLLYPVYVCYIVTLFVTDEATIKAKRFICFLKGSRVITLSFVVKSKLVTVLL